MTEARIEEATVRLVDPITGETAAVPEAEGARLRKLGWREPTEAEAVKARQQEAAEGALGTATAFALGTGKYIPGATAGLRALAGATGTPGEQFAEGARALAEAHPMATEAGGLAGAVAGGELLGTAGLGARAMGALGAEGALARVGGAVVTGTAEGAIQGVGEVTTAMALGEEDVSASALLEGGLYGAVLGGALGGGLSAGAMGAKAAGRKLLQLTGGGGGGIRRAIGRGWARTAELAGVENAQAVERFNPLVSEGRAALREAQQAPELITTQAKRLVDSLETPVNLISEQREAMSGAAKMRQIRELLPTETREIALEESQAITRKLRQEVDELAGRHIRRPRRTKGMSREQYDQAMEAYREAKAAHEGMYGKKANKVVKDFAAAEKRITNAIRKGDHGEAFEALDNLKRAVGDYSTYGRKKAAEATRQRFTQIYGEIQQHLERPDLWGDAAGWQSQVNPAWSRLLETQDVEGFRRYLSAAKQRGAFAKPRDVLNRTRALEDLVPPKLTGTTADITALERHEAARGAFKEWLTDAEAHLAADPNVKGPRIDKFRKGVREAREAMDELDRLSELHRDWKALSSQSGGAATATAIGYGLGALGPAGAPAAAALGAVTNPARAIRTADSLVRITEGVGGALKRVAPRMRALSRQVPRVATVSSLNKRRRARIMRASTSARQASENPEQLAAQMRSRLGATLRGQPRAVDAVARVAMRGVQYLAEHAPDAGPPRALGQPRMPASDGDLEAFDRRQQTVMAPVRTIMSAVGDGLVTPEHVEALDAVHPQLADRIRAEYRNAVMDAVEDGHQIPYHEGLAIGALLGQPVHGLDNPEVMRVMQSSFERQQRPPPKRAQPKKAMDAASIYKRDNAGLMRQLGG